MRLKSFHARSISEAMGQVRASLGDDAIIVATREEEDGTVRVTAAIEEADALSALLEQTVRYADAAAPADESGELVDVADAVGNALDHHRVAPPLAEKLIDAACDLALDDPVMALSAALDSVFTFQPLAEAPADRPVMLVGPPGSGKTLTVAKLAARAVFHRQSVGVITTDTERAGGVEQLSAFTRLLKVKLTTVEDLDALGDALVVNRGFDHIFIDTAGLNPFDQKCVSDLRRLAAATRLEPILVLPASFDPFEAAEVGAQFRAAGARRIMVTRVDIARRLGGVLSAVYDARLNFCEISQTTQVADGLTPLDPVTLARLLMPETGAVARERPRQTGTHA